MSGGAVPVAGAQPRVRWSRKFGVLPGFLPTLTFTVTYLSLLVLIPLAAMALKTAGMGWDEFWKTVSSSRALSAYKLSFGGALLAGGLNAFLGTLLAWVLVRYRFPGRAVVNAMVDLPLALPTAVAGIALTAVYAPNGPLGRYLEPHGIQIAFAPTGVIMAMVFVGIPFAVRTVQPVMAELDVQLEEAATLLGANRWQVFTKVLLPPIMPSVMTGFALAFARAVGEYGSIVFISGNMPGKTEIVPLLIYTKLEQFDYNGATALAMVMLVGSFLTLLVVNLVQAWSRAKEHHA